MLPYMFIFLLGVLQTNHVSAFMLSPTQQCILNDLSWKVRVKLFNNILPAKIPRHNPVIQALVQNPNELNNNKFRQTDTDIQTLLLRKKNVDLIRNLKRAVAIDFLVKRPVYSTKSVRIDDESSMSIEGKSDSNNKNIDFEAMGVHDGLQTDHNTDLSKNRFLYRRQEKPEIASDHIGVADTDKGMKLKLFRMMYDTVKENDAMIKKADAIKKQYDNSSFFEIGFLMGAITDKVNTMSAVALTVERLFDVWKPVEHVNAYEQIANQAIEINQLVDILKSSHKIIQAKSKPAMRTNAPELPVDWNNLNNFYSYHELKDVKDNKPTTKYYKEERSMFVNKQKTIGPISKLLSPLERYFTPE